MSSAPRVGLVDHGMGNLPSVAKALESAGADVSLVEDPAAMHSQDAICVPGQGIFGRCMENLEKDGLSGDVLEWARSSKPYLGICLGMQILFDRSEERGPVQGLGLVAGEVKRLQGDVRVPHMGWNKVGGASSGRDEYFYFDHSYAAHPSDHTIVSGWCEHGDRFAAAIESGSTVAVQFHPEKSGRAGIEFLRGWVSKL
ncbi:MAG: imidazole glycerol phosphate synthase subunit HisH [Actinomycetota bacterium]|nr:imidazole glycerol phosphate synthase subunit HisH [Actinomycetota bacterium]